MVGRIITILLRVQDKVYPIGKSVPDSPICAIMLVDAVVRGKGYGFLVPNIIEYSITLIIALFFIIYSIFEIQYRWKQVSTSVDH